MDPLNNNGCPSKESAPEKNNPQDFRPAATANNQTRDGTPRTKRQPPPSRRAPSHKAIKHKLPALLSVISRWHLLADPQSERGQTHSHIHGHFSNTRTAQSIHEPHGQNFSVLIPRHFSGARRWLREWSESMRGGGVFRAEEGVGQKKIDFQKNIPLPLRTFSSFPYVW